MTHSLLFVLSPLLHYNYYCHPQIMFYYLYDITSFTKYYTNISTYMPVYDNLEI